MTWARGEPCYPAWTPYTPQRARRRVHQDLSILKAHFNTITCEHAMTMTHLDALPLEILFHILSYTEPIYCLGLTTYPLNALAATNRRLRAAVEAYARGQLVRQAGLERSKMTGALVCRRKWLRDLCYFCKKNSKRKACFYPTLTCCLACDKKEFPKMVCDCYS